MNILHASKYCVLLKINFHALFACLDYLIFLLWVFYKFLDSNRSFTLKMDSYVCDILLVPHSLEHETALLVLYINQR